MSANVVLSFPPLLCSQSYGLNYHPNAVTAYGIPWPPGPGPGVETLGSLRFGLAYQGLSSVAYTALKYPHVQSTAAGLWKQHWAAVKGVDWATVSAVVLTGVGIYYGSYTSLVVNLVTRGVPSFGSQYIPEPVKRVLDS